MSHPYFHKGVSLNNNVIPVLKYERAIVDTQLIVLAIPSKFFRGCIRDIVPLMNGDIIFLNVAKAVEEGTNKFLHTVMEEETVGCPHKCYMTALAGGMLAEEVTKGWPIGADVACEDINVARIVRKLFYSPTFKMNVTTDILGLELAGAFKNVIAIGAGIFDGLGLAVSSKAAYVSEAASEFASLGIALGAQPETFALGTHSWLGDLLTTCFGNSRNRLLGEYIGSGMTVEKAIERLTSEKKISEGYHTARGFYTISVQKNLDLPILRNLYLVLHENHHPSETMSSIFYSDRAKL